MSKHSFFFYHLYLGSRAKHYLTLTHVTKLKTRWVLGKELVMACGTVLMGGSDTEPSGIPARVKNLPTLGQGET